MRVASLDVGSNSVLMLVAEKRRDGSWERVEDHAEVTRISQGLDQSGVLSEEAIARTEAVLLRFAARARALQADAFYATGTAPFRRSSNGLETAERLSRALGFPLDVVSGEEEAALTLDATLASFPEIQRNWLVDIGGASTEVIFCDGGQRSMISLDIGVVRLTERYVLEHPLRDGAVAQLRASVREALQTHLRARESGLPLIGVAGTVTALAALDQRMERWDADRIQGYRMPLSRVEELARELSSLSLEARAALPGLDPRRADVAPAGAWLLFELGTLLEISEVVVSDRGLRWGRLLGGGDR